MSITISIARRDTYTYAGEYDTSLYEIQIDDNGQFVQDIQLETSDDLVRLRNIIDGYIKNNNLDQSNLQQSNSSNE